MQERYTYKEVSPRMLFLIITEMLLTMWTYFMIESIFVLFIRYLYIITVLHFCAGWLDDKITAVHNANLEINNRIAKYQEYQDNKIRVYGLLNFDDYKNEEHKACSKIPMIFSVFTVIGCITCSISTFIQVCDYSWWVIVLGVIGLLFVGFFTLGVLIHQAYYVAHSRIYHEYLDCGYQAYDKLMEFYKELDEERNKQVD